MSMKLRITLVTAVFLACTSVVLSAYTLRIQRAHLYAESRQKAAKAISMLSEMASRPLLQGDILAMADIADRAAAGHAARDRAA
jgi:hypothetical protein